MIISHFNKLEIEEYLSDLCSAIDCNRYQLSARDKNQEFLDTYVIDERGERDIIKTLTADDFSAAVSNRNPGYENEVLYIFGKDVKLLRRYAEEDGEEIVPLYIKFNKIRYQEDFVFIVSFHKQEHPLPYYFNNRLQQ